MHDPHSIDRELRRVGLKRKELARMMKMPYYTLSAKIGGFNRFSPDEEQRINQIIDTHEKESAQMK